MQAVRDRAHALGFKIVRRNARYWLVDRGSHVVPLDPPMTIDELEQNLTRLTKDHVDGCQG